MGTNYSISFRLAPRITPPAVAPDRDFDPRWAAWIARGRARDRRVRRFVTWAFGLSMGAAIVYAFLR